MFKLLVVAVSLAATTCVQAQVQVIESTPQSALSKPAQAVNPQSQLFYQLQTLQQEVQMLRGLVEEQAYEVKRLKQQRLDDYVDLDRRIVALSGNDQPKGANSSAVNSSASVAVDEKKDYDQALQVLRQRDVDKAIALFNTHLNNYPDGQYAANVHYWLGESHLLQGNLEEARQAFSSLVNSYPNDRKLVDAQYKLGTVYFQLGDKAKAKELLDKVALGNSSSARLAQKYLQQNFSQ